MKEQLAKMTIIDLVRTAHSYSTSIKQTGVYSELVREMASRLEALNLAHIGAMAALSSTENVRDQLAAECAGMDKFVTDMLAIAWKGCSADGADIEVIALKHGLIRQEAYCQDQHENLVEDPSNFEDGDPVYFRVETPATARFLAEQRAMGRVEGINYAAGRLAAAYNHGFVDKPLTEVGDVVRMILDARDELTRALIPAADGLSGEYAEKALKEWEAQLRNEVKL